MEHGAGRFLKEVGQRKWSISFLAVILLLLVKNGQCDSSSPKKEGREILPGLEWMEWYYDSGDVCLVRVDPDLFIMRPFHFRDQGQTQPLTLKQWMDKTGANLIFNAGQYYPDYSYMGFLMSNGRIIRKRMHPLFQGMFVAEPFDVTGPRAKILDLAEDPFDPSVPGYMEAAQSFMLFDKHGAIRVRRTSNMAYRTVLAEQRDGKILIAVTRVPFTLWELAKALLDGPFPVKQAISMDGGDEAQIAIRAGDFSYAQASGMAARELENTKPLPTVIGLFPRSNPPRSSR